MPQTVLSETDSSVQVLWNIFKPLLLALMVNHEVLNLVCYSILRFMTFT